MNLSSKIKAHVDANDRAVLKSLQQFVGRKHQKAVLVGGVVRDLIMGRPIRELDVMLEPPVDPLVRHLAQEFKGQIVQHERFMTFTIRFPFGQPMDFVTAREERYPAPARLPEVKPATISRDLQRRDFTINTLICWLNREKYGQVGDRFGSLRDMRDRKIRVLHDKSFQDDPTRLFRAARFASRFQFRVEDQTRNLIGEAIRDGFPSLLSPVRRRHEFERILKEVDPLPALTLLQKWGALKSIHDGWEICQEHDALSQGIMDGMSEEIILQRLVIWLKPWGLQVARKMMDDLKFEKRVKRDVDRRLERATSTGIN